MCACDIMKGNPTKCEQGSKQMGKRQNNTTILENNAMLVEIHVKTIEVEMTG